MTDPSKHTGSTFNLSKEEFDCSALWNGLDQLATQIWVKFVVFEDLASFADIPP